MTAVEWLLEVLNSVRPDDFCSIEKIKGLCEQAKEMEKEQSEKYAEFCVKCDRGGIKLLDFNDYIKL
jgi:hypothetical protein